MKEWRSLLVILHKCWKRWLSGSGIERCTRKRSFLTRNNENLVTICPLKHDCRDLYFIGLNMISSHSLQQQSWWISSAMFRWYLRMVKLIKWLDHNFIPNILLCTFPGFVQLYIYCSLINMMFNWKSCQFEVIALNSCDKNAHKYLCLWDKLKKTT